MAEPGQWALDAWPWFRPELHPPALVVYDSATGHAAAAGEFGTHDGVLRWSTGRPDPNWHTLDLRTA
jgi:hypothetical protein